MPLLRRLMAGRPSGNRGTGYGGIILFRAARCRAMRPAAETPALIAEFLRVRVVDGAQVVQVLRPWALLPALVGGQQRLAESRDFSFFGLVPGPNLRDDICQSDPERQAVGTDPGRTVGRLALPADGDRDRRWALARDDLARPDLAGPRQLAAGIAGFPCALAALSRASASRASASRTSASRAGGGRTGASRVGGGIHSLRAEGCRTSRSRPGTSRTSRSRPGISWAGVVNRSLPPGQPRSVAGRKIRS